ncbi:hypothetical protein RA262_27695, partial [Pseudomonas syringae pv. tagetis]
MLVVVGFVFLVVVVVFFGFVVLGFGRLRLVVVLVWVLRVGVVVGRLDVVHGRRQGGVLGFLDVRREADRFHQIIGAHAAHLVAI